MRVTGKGRADKAVGEKASIAHANKYNGPRHIREKRADERCKCR